MKRCPKCGYTRTAADSAPDYECPACGVVYAKFLAQVSGDPQPTITASPSLASVSPQRAEWAPELDSQFEFELFADKLRSNSLYPVFRKLVALVYFFFVALAVLTLISGAAVAFLNTGGVRIGGIVLGLIFGALFWIIGRVVREVSLMLADLSDAAVRIASKIK